MGIKGLIFEGIKNNKSNRSINNNDQSSHDSNNLISMSKYNAWKLISKLRDINDGYKYKYVEYDSMADDVVIQSALELYADDSTQLDARTQRVVAVESDNKRLQKDLTAFLDSINIESKIWQWSYDLSKYGDLYVKIHNEEDEYGNRKFRLEDIEDPSLIMDLWYEGERLAFAEEEEYENDGVQNRVELNLLPPNSFIHFMIKKSSKTDKLEIENIDNIEAENGTPKVYKYSVVRGTSMIEGVRPIFRILRLLEDSLLAARIAKAEYVRVYNIEVGDDTPRKTTETVNRVKNLFDSKASFDISSGKYKANKNYRPIADPIFNPVRNGKGSVSHEDIGGEFEVKKIIDIDYFNNKLFAGLKIPKAYLGFEESLPGGLGDSTLNKLDIRYSRSIKRIQTPLCLGIKEICMNWLKSNNREVNYSDFKIILQSPSSAEELNRLKELKMRMDIVGDATKSVSDNIGEHVNIPKVYSLLFKNYVQYSELSSELTEEFDNAAKDYDENRYTKEDKE